MFAIIQKSCLSLFPHSLNKIDFLGNYQLHSVTLEHFNVFLRCLCTPVNKKRCHTFQPGISISCMSLVTLRVHDCFVGSLDQLEQNSALWVILTKVSSYLNPLASMITSFENLGQTILHYKCEFFLDEVHLEGRSKEESQSSKENGNVWSNHVFESLKWLYVVSRWRSPQLFTSKDQEPIRPLHCALQPFQNVSNLSAI